MIAVQLDLFENIGLAEEEPRIKEKAKKYTASSIFRSSGHRIFIILNLEKGDLKSALKEFDEAFRNYGFGHKEYSFSGFGGNGKIKIGNDFEFYVTSKELFAELLIMWNEGW